jgi:hypothetical protein
METMTQTHPTGSRTEYLVNLAAAFPARNRHGTVVGFYVYDGPRGGQVAGPFPTIAEAEEVVAQAPTLSFYRVVCGPVFTASGKIVREGS